MKATNPFFRSFVVCGLWQIAVGYRMLLHYRWDWSAVPQPYFVTLTVTWIISALLVGLAASHFQFLRSWLPISLVSIASTFVVVFAMLGLTKAIYPSKARTSFRSAEEKMIYMAKEAANWVKADKSIDLDYTIESIEVVEGQLARLSESINRTNPPPGTYGQAIGYGSYIGEVFRRRDGGVWAEDHPTSGAKSFPLTIKSNSTIFPIAWCWKRIMNGGEDNVYHKALLFSAAGGVPTNAIPTQRR